MGFFSKKKSEEKPEQPVTLYDLHQAAKKEADPAKSGALYLKLIEKAAAEDDQTWLRVGLCELAFGGGAQRDLARLRLLAEKLTDEDERNGFLRDLDELEPRGLEAAGESKERMRAFLLGAALDGSNAAAWQIANCLGAAHTDQELLNAVSLGGLRGDERCAFFMQAHAAQIGGDASPEAQRQYEFWDELYDAIAYGDPEDLPPFEERMAAWQQACGQDKAVIEAKRAGLRELQEKMAEADARVRALEGQPGREEELLAAFCQWLACRDRVGLYFKTWIHFLEWPGKRPFLLFNYRPGQDPDSWHEPECDPEILKRVVLGQALEHDGHDYPKAAQLYREAARLGSGEALYRLCALSQYWEAAGEGRSDEEWTEEIRAAGWPIVSGWRYPRLHCDDPSGLLQLAGQAEPGAVHHLARELKAKWQGAAKRGDPDADERRREALLVARAELALTRKKAQEGDCEACLHLLELYRSTRDDGLLSEDREFRKTRDTELSHWVGQLFVRRCSLVYYMVAQFPDLFGTDEEGGLKAAQAAEAAGLTGAMDAYERWCRDQRILRESTRQKREVQRQESRRRTADRDGLEAEMDAYRDQLDWAERGISAALGGSAVTRQEAFFMGESSTSQYAREAFIRDELEAKRRKELENEYAGDFSDGEED